MDKSPSKGKEHHVFPEDNVFLEDIFQTNDELDAEVDRLPNPNVGDADSSGEWVELEDEHAEEAGAGRERSKRVDDPDYVPPSDEVLIKQDNYIV